MKILMSMASIVFFLVNPAFGNLIEYSVTGQANYLSGYIGSVTGSVFINDQPTKLIVPDSALGVHGELMCEITYWNLEFNLSGSTGAYSGTKGYMYLVFTKDGDYMGPSFGLINNIYLLNDSGTPYGAGSFPFEWTYFSGGHTFFDFQNGIFPELIVTEGMPNLVDGLYPRLFLSQASAHTPEPATLLLFGVGLAGLAAGGRRRQR